MRILKNIESKDKLALLFNEYTNKLSTFETLNYPSCTSMRSFNKNCLIEEEAKRECNGAINTYFLIIVNQSLHEIHWSIQRALEHLKDYKDNYILNWKEYAIDKRYQALNECFSGDPEDYLDDDCLIPKPTEDNNSLYHYSIHYDLAMCFSDPDDERHELIGTSEANDFSYTSLFVEKDAELSPFKLFQESGMHLPLYKYDEETKERTELSIAERIENEINEDIHNGKIVNLFNLSLSKCKEADVYFKSLDKYSGNKEEYLKLEEMLNKILNLNFKN